MSYCFGIDIGGTTVKLGLFDVDGTIVDKWEIVTHTENEGEAILPDVAAAVNAKMTEKGIEKEQVIGIGVGVPAPVSEDGIVNGTANLGWTYKEVKRELEESTGLQVKVENDANVAALGEMWKGGGRGHKDMIDPASLPAEHPADGCYSIFHTDQYPGCHCADVFQRGDAQCNFTVRACAWSGDAG